jgi:amidohydrolase
MLTELIDDAVLNPFTDANLSDATRNAHLDVVAMRRDLHRIPEIGLEEHLTASYIEKKLSDFGLDPVRIADTGVITLLEGAQAGPTVMLRADIDALPVTELAEHEYVSTHDGFMHACGHDSHTAMLLGAARRFREEGIERGRLKIIFQPGEEGRHGAEKMIAHGVMENPKVDTAYGQHIWAMEPIGLISVQDGPVMAAVDTVYVTVRGKGTHAALPHTGHDPIFACSQIVLALQSIVSRNMNPVESGVVTVSEFHGGTAHNVIPEEVNLSLSVRVFDDAVHRMMERRIKEIISGIASTLDCTADIEYIHEHQATINNPEIAEIVREEAAEIVGVDNVVQRQKSLGAEDFSDYARLVPATFAFVGARNAAKDCIYPHHHPKFNVDEDAFAIGNELMYRVAQRLLRR